MGRRTLAWWLTRVELALGIAAFVFASWVVIISIWEPMFGGFSRSPLPPWPLGGVGLVVMAAALARMLWIFLALFGDDDEPPPWRYRDR
jgi:hypothetical protein